MSVFPDHSVRLATVRHKLSQHRFEINHILVFFAVLVALQVLLAFFQGTLASNFLNDAQHWFQKYHAERIAVVTSVSMENLYESQERLRSEGSFDEPRLIAAMNVIFKQLVLQRNVEEITLILQRDGLTYLVKNGGDMNEFFKGTLRPYDARSPEPPGTALQYFAKVKEEMLRKETMKSEVLNQRTFNVLVPFVPHGEYLGAMYLRITPDFTLLTDEIQMSFKRTTFAFSVLVLIGLIVMYVVSTGAVRERNEARERLFEEHQANLEKQIRLEKESIFTKRIYHTHHKAEKIMGFIKSDVRAMDPSNLDVSRRRVIAYSNFISRIIYDMKWYDQDINTIINPAFKSDINATLRFIVENVFLRISSRNDMFSFDLQLDSRVPTVHVNEFSLWEIFEPLLQNSIDHGHRNSLLITVSTIFDPDTNTTVATIRDNGEGLPAHLLENDGRGIKRVFAEKETGGNDHGSHSGYGCYIAYQLAVGKCGWRMDAENLPGGGCCFSLRIDHRM
jgi:signal transduction histidine kinase